MSTDPIIGRDCNNQRYEAVLRISEAIAACRESEELARTLADGLGEFLEFDHLYLMIFKENSREIESMVWGKGPLPLPDLPVEELPTWEAFNSQDTLYFPDWNAEKRFPRAKAWMAQMGVKLASSVAVPLTTPHRRLGTFGITSDTVRSYSEEDVSFLRLIGRVVAFAIDDGLNLRRAQDAQACLQRQNDRLQLLLNLTNRITSNLTLRDVLPAITANIREVMECDAVGVTLPDRASGKFRLYAVDFPQGKGTGILQEETLVTPGAAARRAFENLTPVLTSSDERDDFPPEVYELLITEGLRNHCLVPLVNHGRALGLLVVIRKTGIFTSWDVEILSQVAGQIAIAVENALAYREISDLKDKLSQEKLYLQEEIRTEMGFEQIVGGSATLKHVLELIDTVAPSDSTVLLLGETGTGKELIARAIHDHSRRKDRTFVKLNCAAIPTGLLESELFGHEKGAFTGAISQKVGRLELADQGTLFLDEVGDIPIEIQPKLLRALQEREFERLGSTHTRKVNVRMVAATNRDLEKMIAAREFRSDLYYRLNVFPIRIPPLRDRREDIPLLVSYFVKKFTKQMQKNIETIPASVMKGLTAWEWPGNIRELENFIERAVILTRGKSLEAPLAELRRTNFEEQATEPAATSDKEDIARIVKETLESLNGKKSVADEHARKQREEIIHALSESKGRVGGADGAAARMGINRTTLLSRMKKLGINPRQYA
jgi:formate hydrogenlyase transcriptional activator